MTGGDRRSTQAPASKAGRQTGRPNSHAVGNTLEQMEKGEAGVDTGEILPRLSLRLGEGLT